MEVQFKYLNNVKANSYDGSTLIETIVKDFENFVIPWDGMRSDTDPMVWDGISSVSHGI